LDKFDFEACKIQKRYKNNLVFLMLYDNFGVRFSQIPIKNN